MKTKIAMLLALVISAASYAAELTQPHVEVYGTSKIEVEPDVMDWRLDVKSVGDNLSAVSESHSKTVQEVLKLIQSKKVNRKTVQTSNMSFGENRVYRDNSWIKEGYIATTLVSFKLQDFKYYEPLWVALSKIKGVSVNGVFYDHSDRIGLQAKARTQALLAAKDKAYSLAQTLGMGIGDPISINEIDNAYEPIQRNKAMYEGGFGNERDSSLSLGTISMSMRVRLVMGLVPK